eukprot:scaffold188987_cov53-Attheya_sp.AAC.2
MSGRVCHQHLPCLSLRPVPAWEKRVVGICSCVGKGGCWDLKMIEMIPDSRRSKKCIKLTMDIIIRSDVPMLLDC